MKKIKDLAETLIEDWGEVKNDEKHFLGTISTEAFLGYITAMTLINYHTTQTWSPQEIYNAAKKLIEEKKL